MRRMIFRRFWPGLERPMIDAVTDFHSLFGLKDQGVRAVCSTRQGGSSQGAYQGLNLATHVGDQLGVVMQNRGRLAAQFDLQGEPRWLNQVHGAQILKVDQNPVSKRGDAAADGATTAESNTVLAILTADCLPILLSSCDGSHIAVVHAGWRGLLAGVIEAAVAGFQGAPLCAWIGPAIGPCHFEVGPEFKTLFAEPEWFLSKPGQRDCFDLPQAALRCLDRAGVTRVVQSGRCTVCEVDTFYSYRKEGVTGRFASLLWRL